jgi:two-component system chemotaxis response regulator CheY
MSTGYSNLKVLIVEDDYYMQRLLRTILEQIGFPHGAILESSNGLEALELLETHRVDFIICDWYMDKMDGPTLVKILRDPRETPAPGVPVILCSGNLERKRINQILDAGVNEAIVKPISIGAVESRVRAVMTNPRPIVKNEEYVGPDRRRRDSDHKPRERRSSPRSYAVD